MLFRSDTLNLAVFQVIQFLCLIFHGFLFSRHNQDLKCPLLIFHVFQFPRHIPGHAVFESHFPRLSVFAPKYRSYSMHFSFSTNFVVSRHILSPTVFISHFTVFHLSCHIPAHSLFVSHFPGFSVFFFFLLFVFFFILFFFF